MKKLLIALTLLCMVVGGSALVRDPSGGNVQIPVAWLEGSPFADYLIPGWILLVVLGVAPLVVAFGVSRDRGWARPAAALVGTALLVWLGVQIAIIGYHPTPPLQLIYGLLGVAILGLAGSPSARRHFALPPG